MGFYYKDETARWRGSWALSAKASERPGKRIVMVGDAKGREAVRQLMKRFEFITAQGLGMAYVLAKKDPLE